MRRTQVNPWRWQDARGYSQAWRVDAPASFVLISGQCPIDHEGSLVGLDDFSAQVRQVFDNIGQVLSGAGASMSDLVQIRVYTTDITKLPLFGRIKAEYIDGPQPASTAIGVTALAVPGMMIEVDALAAVDDTGPA